jgi:cysteine synthase A
LKSRRADVHVVGLEPAGSPAITDGRRGSFKMQGWSGMVPPQFDRDRVDAIDPIGDDEAVEMTRRLAEEEGIFAGISSGANVVGALRLAERLGPDSLVVTLAVDSGFKYMSAEPYVELQ